MLSKMTLFGCLHICRKTFGIDICLFVYLTHTTMTMTTSLQVYFQGRRVPDFVPKTVLYNSRNSCPRITKRKLCARVGYCSDPLNLFSEISRVEGATYVIRQILREGCWQQTIVHQKLHKTIVQWNLY